MVLAEMILQSPLKRIGMGTHHGIKNWQRFERIPRFAAQDMRDRVEGRWRRLNITPEVPQRSEVRAGSPFLQRLRPELGRIERGGPSNHGHKRCLYCRLGGFGGRLEAFRPGRRTAHERFT
jgi:hypothetical protein